MEQQTIEHEADTTVEPAQKQEIAERGEAPMPTSAPSNIITVIERLANNPNVDPDKMEKMIALQERILDREAEQAYSASMTAAQGEMAEHPIVKGAWNDQTKSHYAKLGTINQAITPIYSKHGFSLSFGTEAPQQEGCVRVICEVRHRLGYTTHRGMDVPLDSAGIKGTVNKTGPHALGSSTSYGRRYLTGLIFNLVELDEDDDGNAAGKKPNANNNPTLTTTQLSALRNALKAQGDRAEGAFCKAWSVFQLEDLWQSNFDAAMQQVLRRAERLKAKTQQ